MNRFIYYIKIYLLEDDGNKVSGIYKMLTGDRKMKKLILILGILAVMFLVGCAVEQAEEAAEIPEVIPEPVEVEEPEAEEPAEEETEEPLAIPEPVEEASKSSEIVELEIEIEHEMTNDTQREEATLDKIRLHVRNIKYETTGKHPIKDLRIKAYTSKDEEADEILWINEIIEHEKIRYSMLVTKTESRGGYIFKDKAVITVEVYDSKDILLATASKTVIR